MIYGSYVRGYYHAGRSDLDSVLIFSDDVVIDKKLLHEVSTVVYKALQGKNDSMREIFQVTPLDRTTMLDGRFNSFTDDFCEYFKDEGKTVFGKDYRNEMVCLHKKTGKESRISHNLRKSRQALLFAEYDKREDYEQFLKGFLGTLNTVSRGSKEILSLIDGKIRKDKLSSLTEMCEFFPDVDIEPLERIKDLYYHPTKLDDLYTNQDEVLKLWNSSLSFFEEVIRQYIVKFPRMSE
ncbi:MAG: hypothetical protein J7J92_01085 [Candidatus Aenigmarchaeota archaeon]|nr:hypothetical protein [Candidatus Aenigmarchaeota archaeon]